MRDITDFRTLGADLRESEAIIRSILETAGNVILFLNQDLAILDLNHAAEDVYGCKRVDVLGKNYVHLFVEEDCQPAFEQEMAKVFAGESTINFESAVVSLQGVRRIMLWNCNRFYDNQGRPQGIIAIGQDITERKHAEEELRYSEERFRTLISSVNDFVFTMDTKHRYTGIYGGPSGNSDMDSKSYIGKTPVEIFGKAVGDTHIHAMKQALAGETSQFEWSFSPDHNTTYYFHTVLSPLKDYDGHIIGVVGIRRDITESKTAQRALQESEARLRTIVETAVDAIITINEDGIIESVNSAVERLFGFTQEELMGNSINMLMPEPYDKEHDGFIRRYLQSGEKRIIGIGREVVGKRKDGTVFPITLSVSEFFLGDRRMFTGIIHDISEQKELQEKILQSERLAIIGKMAAKVAHEVRNPLSSISLNAELLEDEIDHIDTMNKDEVRALLKSMIREIDRVTSLTDEYLQFSRLPETHLEKGDICELIEDLVSSLHVELEQRRVQLRYEGLKERIKLKFDRVQMRRVLVNLIRNAFEAMPKGGKLLLRTDVTDGMLNIYVEDTGTGIPEDMVGSIFDPFFTTKDFGTGLGLAISQQIILEHDGRITCDSVVGKGTTFRIELPI